MPISKEKMNEYQRARRKRLLDIKLSRDSVNPCKPETTPCNNRDNTLKTPSFSLENNVNHPRFNPVSVKNEPVSLLDLYNRVLALEKQIKLLTAKIAILEIPKMPFARPVETPVNPPVNHESGYVQDQVRKYRLGRMI
jgi:hypothetical protein